MNPHISAALAHERVRDLHDEARRARATPPGGARSPRARPAARRLVLAIAARTP